MDATEDARWVVVSGGGGVLGSALTAYYANTGRRVLALDKKFETASIDEGLVSRCAVDLTSQAEVVKAIVETVPSKEGISLLINAVGYIRNEPLVAFKGAKLSTHSFDGWQDVIAANLTAPFVVATQVAAYMMRRGGGSIVNFSSIASGGNVGQVAYSAAKSGVEGLTRAMALELGVFGVRVNAVSLGFVDVRTTRDAVAEGVLSRYRERTPLGRLGQIADVISAVDFLHTNTFMNGAIVKVDGGLRL